MKKILIFFLFLVLAITAGAAFWYWQKNQFSKEEFKVEISGPALAQASEEISYAVRLKNNGRFRVEAPEFSFNFPKNAVPSDDKPMRITQQLEDIYPGEERTFEFKARLFGKKNETVEAKAVVTYQLKNLKNRYESKTGLATQINLVPLNFEFDMPARVETGEKVNFTLNYFSSMDYPLENLRVRIEYPSGFKFSKSKPVALDEKEWKISNLVLTDGGRIEISGSLDGGEGDQKIFKAQLGFISQDGEFVLLQEAAQVIKIASATLNISQAINGSPNYIANVGDVLHYEILFKNIGQKPMQNKFLMAKLEGDFFDLSSIKLQNGEMASGDNSIIWDGKNVSALKFLEAGEEGRVEFWVKVVEGSERRIKNPSLVNRVMIAGTERIFETKINSEIALSQKLFYKEDIFGNSGPWPLESATATTFTVVWQVKNTWSDLKNVKVKSYLAENVLPTGKVFPSDAKLTFDSGSREVIWNIGDVAAFRGYNNEPLTLAFQITVISPAEGDLSKVLIIDEATLLAEDVASTDLLQVKVNAMDTSKIDDIGGGEPTG